MLIKSHFPAKVREFAHSFIRDFLKKLFFVVKIISLLLAFFVSRHVLIRGIPYFVLYESLYFTEAAATFLVVVSFRSDSIAK